MSAGAKLRDAVARHAPLQVPGTINAYCALLAERAGFEAIYLSGAGVANASFGLPDLGVTTLNDVLEDARRITAATELPLLVDADTGFGSAFNIARTVRELHDANVPVADALAAGTWPFPRDRLTDAVARGYAHLAHESHGRAGNGTSV